MVRTRSLRVARREPGRGPCQKTDKKKEKQETIALYQKLQSSLHYLSNQELIESGQHSKSIFYEWLKGPTERKQREVTLIPEEVAVNAIAVIINYPVAFVTDVFSTKYLGYSTQPTESSDLVEEPVVMAVAENNNAGPKAFLLSDHGSQYVSNAHGELLAKHDIVQKHIPTCKPQYNGSIECGMRDFKSIFYNVFAQHDFQEFAAIGFKATDNKKKLLETVKSSVKNSIEILNEQIPRPSLGGVTPTDVDTGCAEQKRKLNHDYLMKQQIKEKVKRWSKSQYELVKEVLHQKNLSQKELLIKHYFFQKRPLRRISKIPIEVWTN